MSLRRKFLVLIALLAVTVSVNAAAAVWAIVHYQQAIAQPLSSLQLVLEHFQIVKRSLGEQHNILARLATGVPTAAIGPDAAPAHEGPPDLDSIRARQRRLHQQADTRLAFLEHEVPAYKLFAGIGTTANIRHRMDHAHATIDAWFESLPPESPAAQPDQSSPQLKVALTDLFLLHELIELTEDQVAVLAFGGGCQGCAAVDLTLKEGVEKTLMERIPELAGIRDVTDHTDTTNAYYR